MSPELSIALKAVQLAESIVMQHYNESAVVNLKPDASPVTQADIAAENIIIETIRSRFPDHRIIGEESGTADGNSDFTWIIDPIDGTKNFIRAIPFFGIELALIRQGEPIIGVSSLPALDERLYAQSGCGAFFDGRQGPVRVSNVERVNEAFINFGGLNHFLYAGEIECMARVSGSAARVRAIGDAYGYHLLATGRCEAVIERKIKFWDIAALSVIVHEAGGKCTDLQGRPVKEKTRSAFFSNGYIHDELLSLYHNKL